MIGELQLACLLALACLGALHASGRLEFVAREMDTSVRRWLALGMLLAVLTAAVFLPVTTFGRARDFDPGNADFWALFAGHLLLVLFLTAWWFVARRPPLRDFLALPRHRPTSEWWSGVFAGAVGWAVTLLVTAVVAASAGRLLESQPSEPPPVMLWLAELPAWRKGVIVVTAMTVEEGFFRAFLQARLGLVISTTLFTLAHFSYGLPLMVVAVFTISLVFGTLFAARRNLVPCMIAHGVFDAIQIYLIIPFAVRQMT